MVQPQAPAFSFDKFHPWPILRVEKEPDDNKFIECAAALKADFIITGDKALLEIQDYMAIKIVSPKDFLSSYKWKQPSKYW